VTAASLTSTADAGVVSVHSPADGSVVAVVPSDGRAGIRTTSERLRDEQRAWERAGVAHRKQQLADLRDWILDHDRELIDQLVAETGKARQDAALEVMASVDVINFFNGRAAGALGTERRRPHGPLTLTKEQTIARRPYALVGVVCPWNFPILLAVMDAVPALLAGAAVLLKPSELTPVTIGRIVDAFDGPLAVVNGTGKAGEALVDEVDYVQFTGSTATGRKVAKRAAERLIPCGLELGGKDPMLVLDDAPLERAANAAVWGALFNSGQTCTSVERIYVADAIHDAFVDLVTSKVDALDDSDLGTMAHEGQLKIVDQHVRDAVKRGATVKTGGGPRAGGHGLRYAPTVLTDVTHDMKVMREETFGPLIPIMRVASEDEAIARANDSDYGLSASVWCKSHERGLRVAAHLEAGAVNVNDVFANLFALPLPMSGWKTSGLGARLGGDDAIRKYCRTQAVTVSRVTPAAELAWYPYTATKWAVMNGVVRLAGARDLKRRLSALRGG
jgi:acyl-CoA reductase-like NAD-dependent aldehyde dehydrogenase